MSLDGLCMHVEETDVLPAHVMNNTAHPYLFLAIFFVAAIGFAVVPLILARVWAKRFSPAKPGAQKNATYECGLEAKGDVAIRFRPEYYLYAILFLVFDVEVVFLMPFAAAFTQLSGGACLAMVIFLVLLIDGLVWAMAKGILRWR